MIEDGKYAAFGLGDDSQNVVMNQVAIAIRHLKPVEAERFFGLKRRRCYLCPVCHDRADKDWQDEFPNHAQFVSAEPGERDLHCIVCGETSVVERIPCHNSDCPADVIYDGVCLLCLREQDAPNNFRFGLSDEKLDIDREYSLDFRTSGRREAVDLLRFPMDDDAIAHAKLALEQPSLTVWENGIYLA